MLGSVSISILGGPGQFAALGGKAVPGMRPADSDCTRQDGEWAGGQSSCLAGGSLSSFSLDPQCCLKSSVCAAQGGGAELASATPCRPPSTGQQDTGGGGAAFPP